MVVLGTGRTAPGIAGALASTRGSHVLVVGRNSEHAQNAARTACELTAMDVRPAPFSRETFWQAALVVETVVEDLAVKQEVLSTAERWLPSDALITSNTSSLSISALGDVLMRPGNFAGLHFLHPAHLTNVVEVVPARGTSESTMKTLSALVNRMDKRPIALRDEVPGFVWNRLQFALLREAIHLLDEGVADVEAIDAAVSDGLAPRWLAGGPFACADLGGLGTFARASQHLLPHLAASREVSDALLSRADQDDTFYRWTPKTLREIESLRHEALTVGRQLSEQRRATMARRARS